MPLQVTMASVNFYMANLSVHSRWALMTYMFIKGIRWAARSNLSLILVVSLFFASVQAFYQATLLVQIVEDCVVHVRCLYATWIVYTILLDIVLYYRAWCISPTKSHIQKYSCILMVMSHAACLIVDADYSLSNTRDLLTAGCVTYPGWPRTVLGVFSTVNDLYQAVLFCVPLLQAVRNGVGMRRDTSIYRRMILKSTVCLGVCVVMNITYAILVAVDRQVISLFFCDMALIFQSLSACEIQFNSHRETDKASLGGIGFYKSPVDRQKNMPTYSQSNPTILSNATIDAPETTASMTGMEDANIRIMLPK
ncbi:expressed protein [Batrachochytrium dendrobatidis JAM81]|uniref:Expressed protein n=1 Tax=Batrachochytrium dendrobatidis (strain JAM81 / FGSC 10211) TaxID=684364 RepID=F4NX91_BATDJ|nr:uncharacterized protein BATDEDRAFT_36584 [Batrachochytrium dendrobatidis JAM81]EGF82630.1 expressed protein [Batrachochytrium dendrobatidis JAM81]KAJ8328456.1 hypothetical protein O5D80_003808 [Batrachochytrium dendrobatidis]KAK5666983.1 hypothetical protein QVD99_006204 [Batrachochytrium dendrobatidis]|eukprot:XP_006676837.1 expressed protein [Batrachochytrium dendrobatidis JAM81]